MQSRRLPGKPLRMLYGRPMLGWVYERARESALIARLTIATDSDAILAYCGRSGIPALLTSSLHTSGTDRLIEVMEHETAAGLPADVYANIQGDEPMVTSAHMELLIRPFLCTAGERAAWAFGLAASLGDADPLRPARDAILVSTLRTAISPEAAKDPNAVKVVTDARGRALYFSRAKIPFDHDNTGQVRYSKHLGFYAYSVEALRRFRSLPPSPLEQAEGLEQLRFLENGIPIAVIETLEDTIGVDTEEDLRRVEEHFRRTGAGK